MRNNEYFEINGQYCIHVPEQIKWIVIIPDLSKFYEELDYHKHNIGCIPLIQDEVISIGDKKFRTDRLFKQDYGQLKIGCVKLGGPYTEDYITEPKRLHCYVFIDITSGGSKVFAKTPSYVHQALNDKKIIVTNREY